MRSIPYFLLRKILFCLEPEQAHVITLQSLKLLSQSKLSSLFPKKILTPHTCMGITFPNIVGLAAGLDKNADYIDALAILGFGFIEIGTVTPKPQAGNPKPRLFRLVEQEALINRMGFNNKGVEHVVQQLGKTRYQGILGVNIGKNKDTSLEHAIDDYLFCFQHLCPFASYITINVSSPNTPDLRSLQQTNALDALLSELKEAQKRFAQTHQYVPLVVKISPDLSEKELEELAATLLKQHIDGVIATNTTIHRKGVEKSLYVNEAGGLSGRPLQTRSTTCIHQLHRLLQNKIPIIASGGIMNKASAQEKLQAGAQLLQIYTGLIYHGPAIIREILL